MPMHGRSARSLSDHRLKVKIRRQERRKSREVMRNWLGDALSDDASN